MMKLHLTLVCSFLAVLVLGSPAYPSPTHPMHVPEPTTNLFIGPMGIEIHSSCNATKRNQLVRALKDAETLVNNALEHTLAYGSNDKFYRKYFGKGPSAEVIGWYKKVVYPRNKKGVLLRCDDIDRNCAQPGWAGHWRGKNGTLETVICDLSFTGRRSLDQMCAYGYDVASNPANLFFSSDLIHRLFHISTITENYIDHYTEDFAGCLEYAKTNETYAVRNSESLQYFALDVYAYDVAVPGIGCSGKPN